MKVEFSKHAIQQMDVRNISKNEVFDVLNNYDALSDEDNETTIYSKLIVRSNKTYLYRVFVNRAKKPLLVITVYRTSKIEKYGYKIQ